MNRLFTLVTTLLFLTTLFVYGQERSSATGFAEIDKLISRYQYQQALVVLSGYDSLDVSALQRAGSCYFHMGNYGKAISKYKKIQRIDSTNVNSLFQLGQLYARSLEYSDSYQCYQKLIRQDSTNSIYFKHYALVATQANDPLVALANYYKAVSLNGYDVEAYALFANLLMDMDQHFIADSILTVALGSNESAQLTMLLAKAQMGMDRFEDAIRTTNTLLIKGDTLHSYSRIMAVSNFQLDKYEDALMWLERLSKVEQHVEWISYYKGVSYQQIGMPDSAITYLNQAIEEGISENISTYYSQLASSYEDAKDYKSAIKYYKAAYESSRKDILLYHLGRNCDVYYKDKKQAISYFKRYLNSEDTIRLAREYTRKRLEQLGDYR